MKKPFLASVFTICLGLVAATSWVLLNPVPARAASGTADCGNNIEATCLAAVCVCIDMVGCTGFDLKGNETSKVTCIGKRIEAILAPQGGILAE